MFEIRVGNATNEKTETDGPTDRINNMFLPVSARNKLIKSKSINNIYNLMKFPANKVTYYIYYFDDKQSQIGVHNFHVLLST